MRPLSVVLVVCGLCACASDGRVTAHISQTDVGAVTNTVAAIDSHAIISISPIYEQRPVPGSIPVKMVELGPIVNHKVQTRPSISYERTDRITVQMAADPGRISGRMYVVEKRNGQWRIVSRSFWIQ
jgi:hypothetical protein